MPTVKARMGSHSPGDKVMFLYYIRCSTQLQPGKKKAIAVVFSFQTHFISSYHILQTLATLVERTPGKPIKKTRLQIPGPWPLRF